MKGREFIVNEHSWDIRAKQMLEIYEKEIADIGEDGIRTRPRRPSVFLVCENVDRGMLIFILWSGSKRNSILTQTSTSKSTGCGDWEAKFLPLHEAGVITFYSVNFKEDLEGTEFELNSDVDMLFIKTSVNSFLEKHVRYMELERGSRKGIIVETGVGTSLETFPGRLSDHYDILAFDDESLDVETLVKSAFYLHPNTIRHISTLGTSELEYVVLTGTLMYPRARASVDVVRVETKKQGEVEVTVR